MLHAVERASPCPWHAALVMLFLGMGVAAGYTAARSYKTFKGKNWQRTTLYTAFLFPGFVFAIIFFLNLFVWAEGSSQAIPFVDMFVVLVRRLAAASRSLLMHSRPRDACRCCGSSCLSHSSLSGRTTASVKRRISTRYAVCWWLATTQHTR